MSLISNLFSLQMNTRRASDAEFGMMRTSSQIINRACQPIGSPSFGMNNLSQLHQQEKNDIVRLQTLSLMRKISNAMAESAKERLKEKNLDYYA